MNKKEIGNLGEKVACEYLQKRGYTIVERNFLCRSGEIDIIAIDKEELVFIEVKTRSNKLYGQPIDAVDYNKIKHMYKTVQYYTFINNIKDMPIRLDVIEIYMLKNNYKVHHIKKAIDNRPNK